MLVFTGSAFASTSVRLEQPKSPTNQSSFDLTFVALDTDDNAISVQCFKKGPSDGSFSQFGSTISLSAGGNTDTCPVDSSVLNQQGTYAFYVTANNGSSTISSDTVTVDFNNSSGPGTPSDYSKDHPSSCEYKISFKSADDSGKTVKVELYRSDSTSFNIDSGSRVQSMAIGSNTTGTFTDNVPDCSKSYYYAIRAFDSAGNGSGVVGDSQIHTINPTAAPTQGAIQVSSGNNTAGNTQANTANSSVLGTKTDVTVTPEENTEKKDVLGAQATTTPTPTPKESSTPGWTTYLYAGLGTLLALVVLFVLWKRFKKSQ